MRHSEALSLLVHEGDLQAYICEDKTIDFGDRSGLFQAALELAQRDGEFSGWLRWRLESALF